MAQTYKGTFPDDNQQPEGGAGDQQQRPEAEAAAAGKPSPRKFRLDTTTGVLIDETCRVIPSGGGNLGGGIMQSQIVTPDFEFISYGDSVLRIAKKAPRGDGTQPHVTVEIVEKESDTAPGEFLGLVMYSAEPVEEDDGERINVVDGFSAYKRFDPHRQRPNIEFDPETGTLTDISDPLNPVIISRNAHIVERDSKAKTFSVELGEIDDAGRDMLDAFSRRQEKSRAQMTRAALEAARTYNSHIAQALSESTAAFTDALLTTIAPAIREAERTAQERTPAIRETVSKMALFTHSLPKMDADYLRTIGETMRTWARENVVSLTMASRWKEINGLDDDDVLEGDDAPEPTAKTVEAPGNSLIDALRYLAAAYSETHGGIDAIISDDGTAFDLPPEAEADINRVIDEYAAFHVTSGAESYMISARMYAKTHFPDNDPDAIVVSDRLAAISQIDLQAALQTRPNPTAFIAPLGTGMLTRFKWDEKTGQVINAKTKEPIKQTPVETAAMMKTAAEAATTPDFVGLVALYGILLENRERFEGDNIVVPLKKFAAATGIDLSAGHANDIEKKFALYDPYVGWINGQGLFRVLTFVKRDDVRGTITFSAPYLNRLLTLVKEKSTRKFRDGRTAELGHNHLTHATIYSERNQTAVAIAIFIGNLLLQNQQQPNRKTNQTHVISSIKFSTLAEHAEFAPRIEQTAATREKSRMLRATFTKALELLRTKTDCYQYFDGLELYTLGKDGQAKTFATIRGKDGTLQDNLIGKKEKYNAIAPTFAEYGSILYLRHKGANRHWKHDD